MLRQGMGCMKNFYRTPPGHNHLAVGKPDPLIAILAEQLVMHRPVVRLVLAPLWVDLAGDLRREACR